MSQFTLSHDDPTVFVKCMSCSRTGRGSIAGSFYGAAYAPKKVKRAVCPNCEGSLTEIFRIKVDRRA